MHSSDHTGARASAAVGSRVSIADSAWPVVPAPSAAEASSEASHDARVERERPLARASEAPRRVTPHADAPDPHPPGITERDAVRRVFDERTGEEWRVSERDARHIPGARGARCLVFDGEGIVRRVWHVPPDWPALAPQALLGLMDRHPLHD
jgi:hypothetical protein